MSARTIAKVTDRFSSGATKLGYNRAGQALFVLIPALAGAGLGWALTAVLDWLLSLSWIPFRGPVILGQDGNELAREKTDRPAARLSEAFSNHGYPWRAEGDPRAGDFRLWSESAQDLPAGARPMLSMRARALKEKKAADATDLRAELINLGVVVRDEGGKQYWRLAGRPTDSLKA